MCNEEALRTLTRNKYDKWDGKRIMQTATKNRKPEKVMIAFFPEGIEHIEKDSFLMKHGCKFKCYNT